MATENNKQSYKKMRDEILKQRYLWKDKHGNVVETEEQMYRRVANAIASVEAKYGATDDTIKAVADEFYEFMANDIFLPNTPTLMNAGRKDGVLGACFVLPIEDSMDGIFTAITSRQPRMDEHFRTTG